MPVAARIGPCARRSRQGEERAFARTDSAGRHRRSLPGAKSADCGLQSPPLRSAGDAPEAPRVRAWRFPFDHRPDACCIPPAPGMRIMEANFRTIGDLSRVLAKGAVRLHASHRARPLSPTPRAAVARIAPCIAFPRDDRKPPRLRMRAAPPNPMNPSADALRP